MKTRVVNLKKESFDVFIGRPGPLGNPFKIGRDGNRAEVIALHREYLRTRVKIDPQFKALVLSCDGKAMGCYCKPLPCHGDNYVEYIEEEHT